MHFACFFIDAIHLLTASTWCQIHWLERVTSMNMRWSACVWLLFHFIIIISLFHFFTSFIKLQYKVFSKNFVLCFSSYQKMYWALEMALIGSLGFVFCAHCVGYQNIKCTHWCRGQVPNGRKVWAGMLLKLKDVGSPIKTWMGRLLRLCPLSPYLPYTARSHTSIVPVDNLYNLREFWFNSVTKHDLQVDSSNGNAQGKR